jgi:hypothetical protein
MGERMLAGFALLKNEGAVPAAPVGADRNTIATPIGTRLQRIIRLYHGWRLWTATNDFHHGTYLELFDDGRILHNVARHDEGDEHYWVRPSDEDKT